VRAALLTLLLLPLAVKEEFLSPPRTEVLGRILKESGVDQRTSAPPWSDYVRILIEAFLGWLVPHAKPLGDLFRGHADALQSLLWIVLVLIFLGVLGLLGRALLSRKAPRRLSPPVVPPGRAEASSPLRDRETWRSELESRLAAGDVRGALEALWWWFAGGVSAGVVEASWTSRELLVRSGREDLAPFARTLDLWIYGTATPPAPVVRHLVGRLEGLL
jgi:hypothetical protein